MGSVTACKRKILIRGTTGDMKRLGKTGIGDERA